MRIAPALCNTVQSCTRAHKVSSVSELDIAFDETHPSLLLFPGAWPVRATAYWILDTAELARVLLLVFIQPNRQRVGLPVCALSPLNKHVLASCIALLPPGYVQANALTQAPDPDVELAAPCQSATPLGVPLLPHLRLADLGEGAHKDSSANPRTASSHTHLSTRCFSC